MCMYMYVHVHVHAYHMPHVCMVWWDGGFHGHTNAVMITPHQKNIVARLVRRHPRIWISPLLTHSHTCGLDHRSWPGWDVKVSRDQARLGWPSSLLFGLSFYIHLPSSHLDLLSLWLLASHLYSHCTVEVQLYKIILCMYINVPVSYTHLRAHETLR